MASATSSRQYVESFNLDDEVWFTNPGQFTQHGYIHKIRQGGVYVVLDDHGITHLTRAQHMEHPTSIPILRAEKLLAKALDRVQRATDLDIAVALIQGALYELAKPEAVGASY